MRCETCQGRGQLKERLNQEPEAARKCEHNVEHFPCPDCGGSGIAHCRDGLCEQPDVRCTAPCFDRDDLDHGMPAPALLSTVEPGEELTQAWRDGLRPDPALPVAEWAARHRVLGHVRRRNLAAIVPIARPKCARSWMRYRPRIRRAVLW